MIEPALFTELSDNPVVSPLVTDDDNNVHIYPNILPSGFPDTQEQAITYTLTSELQNFPLARKSRWQLNCFGKEHDQAMVLGKAVDDALNGLTDYQLGGTHFIRKILVENRAVLFDDESSLWYYIIDISINE